MGLHNTAHYLKSKGRGGDTELVHMDKGEVQALKGLAAAHGKNLTTNPETGLPEAGILSSILPAVAGIATAAFAPELLPLVAGGIGLADYAMTGSLTQGLMAGVSAYGAGSLGESLAATGAAADALPAAGSTAETTAGALAQAPAETGGLTSYQEALGSSLQTTPENASEYFNQVGTPGNTPVGNIPAPTTTPPPSFSQNLSNMATGITQPGAFTGNYGNLAMAAAPLAMNVLSQRPGLPAGTPGTTSSTNPFGLASLSSNFQPSRPTQPNPYYTAQYPNYQQQPYQAATGGIIGMASGGSVPSYSGNSTYGSVVGIENATQDLENLYKPRPIIDTPSASVGIDQDTDPNTRNLDAYSAALYRINQKANAAGLGKNAVTLPKEAITLGKINPDNTPDTTDMASGGITSLGSYAAGGNPRLLKGPGDGMSDSIPANIGGKQPARLADGEFVVPADVVSHLGNGSTDAGAKKLYAMMDKIRQARTGKKKQAPEVKADKYIPK